MVTEQILTNIRENGGFTNFHCWNKKEVAEWVQANFTCSKYVANRVAEYIV